MIQSQQLSVIVLHIFISINTALINLSGLTDHRELVDILCMMSSARPHRKQTAVNVPTINSIIPYIARKNSNPEKLGREIVKGIPKQPKLYTGWVQSLPPNWENVTMKIALQNGWPMPEHGIRKSRNLFVAGKATPIDVTKISVRKVLFRYSSRRCTQGVAKDRVWGSS